MLIAVVSGMANHFGNDGLILEEAGEHRPRPLERAGERRPGAEIGERLPERPCQSALREKGKLLAKLAPAFEPKASGKILIPPFTAGSTPGL
jgi:hypothetical protein